VCVQYCALHSSRVRVHLGPKGKCTECTQVHSHSQVHVSLFYAINNTHSLTRHPLDPSDLLSESRNFTVELHVGGHNLLEFRVKPVVLVLVLQEGVVAEELRVEAVRLHTDTVRATEHRLDVRAGHLRAAHLRQPEGQRNCARKNPFGVLAGGSPARGVT